eukprot:TRINITY_DN163_c0_g2_i5.p2 TRINITY_DN163_c0_g2~~TRINITY_DN163_c0_g2_i5.p2  ORF type:complete len:277 (-),score=55.05 TRINITY_DN163_c0_g2_i5:22-852(-)
MCIRDRYQRRVHGDFMFKYRKIRSATQKNAENEVRVSSQKTARNYLRYIAGVFEEKKFDTIVIRGAGFVISKCLTIADRVRNMVKGIHEIVNFENQEIEDIYEPLEEGLDRVVLKKKVPMISITLSLKPLEKDHPGYHAPVPESQIVPFEIIRGGPAGMRRGAGMGPRRRGGYPRYRDNYGPRYSGYQEEGYEGRHEGGYEGGYDEGYQHPPRRGFGGQRRRRFGGPRRRAAPRSYNEEESAPRPRRSFRGGFRGCLLYTSPSPRDLSTSRMPSSA